MGARCAEVDSVSLIELGALYINNEKNNYSSVCVFEVSMIELGALCINNEKKIIPPYVCLR
jgi:hypothetical protein